MDEKEKFRKELEYIPIRNVKMPKYEERDGRERREKRKIPSKRKIKGIAAYIGTMALIGTSMAIVIPREQAKQRQKVARFEEQVRQELANERAEKIVAANEMNEISEIEKEINSIEPTKEAIEENIVKQYLAEYNKEHDANIENCQLMSSTQDYVFVTADNQYVTHGDHPQEVMDFFNNNGITYGTTGGDTKVYYSYADGVTLEMMTQDENRELVDVTSGQNLEQIHDESYNNTLIEMSDVLAIGAQWAKEPENETLKEKYIQALEDYKEKDQEKDNENQIDEATQTASKENEEEELSL